MNPEDITMEMIAEFCEEERKNIPPMSELAKRVYLEECVPPNPDECITDPEEIKRLFAE